MATPGLSLFRRYCGHSRFVIFESIRSCLASPNQEFKKSNLPLISVCYHIRSQPLPQLHLTIPFINPRRACAARVTVVVLCVCLFVCLSATILALQATRRVMSDTNSFLRIRSCLASPNQEFKKSNSPLISVFYMYIPLQVEDLLRMLQLIDGLQCQLISYSDNTIHGIPD